MKKLEKYKAMLDATESTPPSTVTEILSTQEQLSAVSLEETPEMGVAAGSKKKSKAQRRKVTSDR